MMKLFATILLALNIVSFASCGQTLPKQEAKTAVFKEKLQLYFEKHINTFEDQIAVKPSKDRIARMPTVNLRSLMVDEDLGLAYEFATKKFMTGIRS